MLKTRRARTRYSVQGQIQGVGFRPFVCRLAQQCSLGGYVANTSHGAEIEVEGDSASISTFENRLRNELPPLADIFALDTQPRKVLGSDGFRIETSRTDSDQDVQITPDVSICQDCLGELGNCGDRRYRFPFINCANCGPRYSIVKRIPYDRPNTTMRVFDMCPACQREYVEPADRRFHAQPTCCPACGPRVRLVDPGWRPIGGEPIAETAALLRSGRIVAIKGIGGFHLACRADSQDIVLRLRERKRRESKPLAVMVPDLDAARRCGRVDSFNEALLISPARPIVLVPERQSSPLAPAVSRGSPWVGLMLPYAPLHYLLFAEGLPPLVMTSGNRSDEPLTASKSEAMESLGGIADAYLTHNRDIERRIDDSVVYAYRNTRVPVRRARGYVPRPLHLPFCAGQPILAVGGELKSTVCFLQGSEAVLSEHLGDLQSAISYRHFLDTVRRFAELLRCNPQVIAHDMHPAYQSTIYAQQRGRTLIGVQHHHAHVTSCMADAGVSGPVIGIVCDGAGYGTDGGIWGCEILLANYEGFERLGHLRYFALPGADAAARQPWRSALSLLRDTFGPAWRDALPDALTAIGSDELGAVEEMLTAKVNSPPASSLGRLFDGVAAMLGACLYNRHEAEAAALLEKIAGSDRADPYPYSIDQRNGVSVLDPRPMIQAITRDIDAGVLPRIVSARFHQTVAAMLADLAIREAKSRSIDQIVLSGGCFSNRRLLDLTARRIEQGNLTPVWHQNVPPGDGGLSLGQAAVAAARLGGSC